MLLSLGVPDAHFTPDPQFTWLVEQSQRPPWDLWRPLDSATVTLVSWSSSVEGTAGQCVILLQCESWILQLRLGCLVWFSFYCCPLIKQRMMNCWCQRCSLQMGTSWFIIIIIRHMKRIRRTRLMELRTDHSLGCEASNSCNRGACHKLALIWWATTAQLWPENPGLFWWYHRPFQHDISNRRLVIVM